jgi:hypothetical protein
MAISDSNRYESYELLLVTVMHHKMPGNAFVAGSESGFVYSETKVLKNQMLYT